MEGSSAINQRGPKTRRRTDRALARRQEQGEETRARILQAALELFAVHGFDGTTFRDIAKAAGTNHGSIAYHFDTKDKLWREAVEYMFAQLSAEVAMPEEQLGTEEGYKEFIRRYVRYCARHPEHARLMVQESVRGGTRLEWAVERFILPGHKRMAPYSLKQIEKGHLPKVWPWSLAFIIVAMCQAPFTLGAEFKALTGLECDDPDVVEAHADAVIALICGERGERPNPWPETPDWLRASNTSAPPTEGNKR